MKYYLGLNSEEEFNFELFDTFSGVGMIRGENLCINKMQYFTVKEFCDYVTNYLIYVSNNFYGKDVWYRTADLVPHQINLLDGCDEKIIDTQYLIGLRGIRRNLKFIDTYKNELNAFNDAYKINNNLGLLIPYITSVNELKYLKSILNDIGYTGKLGIMIEMSSIIFMLEEIEKMGIDNYTIGVNDLTTNILGAKRDLDVYNINDPAVHKAIKYIVKKVHEFGKEVTLAGYLNKEMFNFAQDIGVDKINIHYNEIPLILDVENKEFYTNIYDSIKNNYKLIKKTRNNNE